MRKILILAVASVLLGSVAFWVAGAQLVRPATADIGLAPGGAEVVSFKSFSGANLRGWYFPIEGARGSVLLMHGVRGNRTNMTKRAELANQLGFSAMSFDFQAHGESEGEAITFGWRESEDAASAVEYLRHRSTGGPVFVIGVSLGGAAALLADPALSVDGMILEAVYPDIAAAVSNRLEMRLPLGSFLTPLFTAQLGPRLGVAAEELAPARAAQTVELPVLIMSGTVDLHTTPGDTRRLFDAFPGPDKTLVWFDGAAHIDLLAFDAELYLASVRDFLFADRGLKRAGGSVL